MHFDYKTENTCSQIISLDIEGDVIHNVQFMGGCNGNLKAIPILVEGWKVDEIEEKLSGILCGKRPTSCGDQLAKAVRAAYEAAQKQRAQEPERTIYDYEVLDADGNPVSLEKYKGKVLLINNSATKCGFTPQYDELQNLYEKYHDQGFEVLDFPCDQFGKQTAASMEEIISFCDSTFSITFPIFDKIDVNGAKESPLYTFLKSKQGFGGFDEENDFTPIMKAVLSMIDPDYENNSDIKWNFTKFLVDKEGHVVKRFEPTDDMYKVEEQIKKLLEE